MLGQPVYILLPDVVGVHLHGELREGANAAGLQALVPLDDVELDPLAFVQGLVAVGLDLGEVDEHVFTAVLLDEAVALLVAEPLHSAFCQLASSPCFTRMRDGIGQR